MKKMNRQQFLRFISAAGLSACALPNWTGAQEGMDKPIWDWGRLPSRFFKDRIEDPSIVGTSHAQNPLSFDVEQLVRDAVEKGGGFDKIIRTGDTVLIKPNLVTNIPNGTGATTDVRVAETVAKMALDCGAKQVVFAEGSSTNRKTRVRSLILKWHKGSALDAGHLVPSSRKEGRSKNGGSQQSTTFC